MAGLGFSNETMVAQLVEALDKNRDGEIDAEEFEDWIERSELPLEVFEGSEVRQVSNLEDVANRFLSLATTSMRAVERKFFDSLRAGEDPCEDGPLAALFEDPFDSPISALMDNGAPLC